MIDAWLPPRDGGTRYFVTSVGTGPQGWLVPEHLRAVVRPPTPKPVVVTPVKPAPVARKRKQAIGTVAAPKVAVAKIAPAKTVPAKEPAAKAKVAATPAKRGA